METISLILLISIALIQFKDRCIRRKAEKIYQNRIENPGGVYIPPPVDVEML